MQPGNHGKNQNRPTDGKIFSSEATAGIEPANKGFVSLWEMSRRDTDISATIFEAREGLEPSHGGFVMASPDLAQRDRLFGGHGGNRTRE